MSVADGERNPPCSDAAQPHRPFKPISSRTNSGVGSGSNCILRRRSLIKTGSIPVSATPPLQFKPTTSTASPSIVRRRVSISAQELDTYVNETRKSEYTSAPHPPPSVDAACSDSDRNDKNHTTWLIKRSESYAFDSSDDSEDGDEMPSRAAAFTNARYPFLVIVIVAVEVRIACALMYW